MSEASMRGRVVRALKSLDAVAVENPCCPGTPDVNFIGGWIELKWLPRWKRNAETNPVLIDHYTKQQRNWLRRRVQKGGKAYLMLQVGREYLLFDGITAADNVGLVARPALRKLAMLKFDKGLNGKELLKCLKT
jgi:hypothetical protein